MVRQALSKFSDTLTLSQPGPEEGADYAHPLALPHLKISLISPVMSEYGQLTRAPQFINS